MGDHRLTRRDVLKLAASFAAALSAPGFAAIDTSAMGAPGKPRGHANGGGNDWALEGTSNFQAIYGDRELRAAFLLFLKNVFHLYPEDRLHGLIGEVSAAKASDREIYLELQRRLPEIKPVLSEVRYALPALGKQKQEMARQTLELLGAVPRINGFLEIGSTGRYLGKLQSQVEIDGDVVLLHTDPPTYSPIDIAERGQLRKLGRFVALNDYAPVTEIPAGSLDLVGNYIGFHHAPVERRDEFMRSLHRALRRGGRLILRDHDVHSPAMNRMVSLAHDVFNMGIGADWAANQAEIRNFTSLPQIIAALEGLGFRYTRRALLQDGDPTQNALMEFVKL